MEFFLSLGPIFINSKIAENRIRSVDMGPKAM